MRDEEIDLFGLEIVQCISFFIYEHRALLITQPITQDTMKNAFQSHVYFSVLKVLVLFH